MKRRKTVFENDTAKYIGKVLKARLKELGMTQYKFVNAFAGEANRPTLTRIFYGYHGTSISTIAHYANLLGLEIRLVKKHEPNLDENGNPIEIYNPQENEDKD